MISEEGWEARPRSQAGNIFSRSVRFSSPKRFCRGIVNRPQQVLVNKEGDNIREVYGLIALSGLSNQIEPLIRFEIPRFEFHGKVLMGFPPGFAC